MPDKTRLEAEFRKDNSALVRVLQIHFMKQAYESKQIPFIVSGTIWDLMTQFWFKTGRQKTNFALTSNSFDKYCGGLSGFMGTYFCNAVASVWGAYYVYDFLHQIGLIENVTYKNALVGIRYNQASINKLDYKLWHNGFPKYWAKPDSMTNAEYKVNTDVIDEAFAKVTPVDYKKMGF